MTFKVSVIVPVYNVEKYLNKCLNSLVNQTLKGIQIIVVNDGTKDNSQKIIDDYVINYPDKVFSFIKVNGGLGDARNFGINYALADYIGFIDSDDYVELDMYEKLYQQALKTNSDIVTCNIQYEWENSKRKYILKGHKGLDEQTNKIMFLSPLFAWNKLYRKSLFVDAGILYPKQLWYEDIPVTIPLFALSKNISYVDQVLVHYVQRNNSIMSTNDNLKVYDIFEILELTKNRLLSLGLEYKFESEIEFIFIEQLLLFGAFRFYKSKYCNDLMIKSFSYIEKEFPMWRENIYIKTLPRNYQFYLKVLNQHNYWIFKLFVKYIRKN